MNGNSNSKVMVMVMVMAIVTAADPRQSEDRSSSPSITSIGDSTSGSDNDLAARLQQYRCFKVNK